MPPDRSTVIETLKSTKVYAIPSIVERIDRMRVLEALADGGIKTVELLLPAGSGLDFLREGIKQLGHRMCIGAGSIVDRRFAEAAIEVGASMIVTPIVAEEVISAARAADTVCICGAQTPTEMVRAMSLGADFVKLFPANAVSPAAVATILVPLPQLCLIAAGAITPKNAASYIKSGAKAVAVGRYLVGSPGKWHENTEIVRRCKELLDSVGGVL